MKRFLLLLLFFGSQVFYGQGNPGETPVLLQDGTVNVCSGVLYDTGGFAGNYENNQDITMTICPDEPGGVIKLDFTMFLLADDGDRLHIYDGQGAGNEFAGSPFDANNIPTSVRATDVTGCVTVRFVSNAAGVRPGWSAKITCQLECQEITADIIQTIPNTIPDLAPYCPEDLGVMQVCIGQEFTLVGDAIFEGGGNDGAVYIWRAGNDEIGRGKRLVHSFDEKGIYKVRLFVQDQNNCMSTVPRAVLVQVSSNTADITLTSDKDVYCVGEGAVLNARVRLEEVPYEPVPPVSDNVALPDTQGIIFESFMEFTDYCASDVITDTSDILEFWISMNHTFLGDLDVKLISPTGATVILWSKDTEGGVGNSDNLGEPPVGGGNGAGWQYGFSDDAAMNLREAPLINGSKAPGIYLPARLPGNSMANLIGSPLNGIWRIQIEDKWGGDRGYFFGWNIVFDIEAIGEDLSFEPRVYSERWIPHPDLVLENGVMKAYPRTPGMHTYTYEVVDNFGCTFTEEITIEFQDVPLIETPSNLSACKDANGNVSFNLTDVEASMSGDPTYIYTYYDSQVNAVDRINPIGVNQVVHVDDSPKQIWVGVEVENNPFCYVVDSFYLIVRDCNLNLNVLTDLYVCAETDTFDLTVQRPLVYNNNSNYRVTFYTALADAELAQNEIAAALESAYPGVDGETVFVRVQNINDPASFEITSFKLIVSGIPVEPAVTVAYGCPTNDVKTLGSFVLSDNNVALSMNVAHMEVTYYRTEFGAQDKDTSYLLPNVFVTPEVTVWVRIENLITGCYRVVPLDLIIQELPPLQQNLVVNYCDTNDDGIGTFDLADIRRSLLLDTNSPDVDVDFYVSRINAENQVNALRSPYSNTIPFTQTIFAHVSYRGNTNCSVIVPVVLNIHSSLPVMTPTPIISCVDNPGRVVMVDLTSKETELLNGLSRADFLISYHTQRSNAEQSINPIFNPREYSNTTSRSIWIRVESIATGCATVVKLDLINQLQPLVKVNIPDYVLCDVTGDDGFESFDLAGYIPTIIGEQLGLNVSFYGNYEDAELNQNSLPTRYTNIVPFVQAIYIRVQNQNNDCFVIRSMNLRVVALPVLNIPNEPVSICSFSNNGLAVFNLISLIRDLQNGVTGLTITFYETEVNALEDLNRIPNPQSYSNLNSNNPTVWVRAFDPISKCVAVKALHLRSVDSPVSAIDLGDLEVCSTEENIGFYAFDLTVQTPLILEAQPTNVGNLGDLLVRYYLSEANAVANQNSISTPTAYINTSSNQVIWYRVMNTVTGCYAVGSFRIKVNNPLVLLDPAEIIQCQEEIPNTGLGVFNLTVSEDRILGGRELFGIHFAYYLSAQDAKNERNAVGVPTAFRNTVNPQTLWVAVTNANGCRSFVNLTVKVVPLPEVNYTPNDILSCESGNAVGEAEFDLTLREREIRNNDLTLKFRYFKSEVDAIEEVDEIFFATRYFTSSTTVWARVYHEINNTKCYVLVPINLRVVQQPVIPDLSPLVGCEVDTDGFFTFNLADKYEEILAGRNADDYLIRFYHSEGNAMAGNLNSMNLTYTNNLRNHEVIWVRLELKDAGCFYVTSLDLRVSEQVFAFPIPDPDPICDDNDGANPINDGRTIIDLTVHSANIVGTQNIPGANLVVVYYASEADYNNNNPILTPNRFQNTTSPQEIYAVVRSTDAENFCEDMVRFTVVVHKKPEVGPIEGGYLCSNLETGEVVSVLIDSKLDATLYDFIWSFEGRVIEGSTNSYIEVVKAGTYTIQVVDKVTGCLSFNSESTIVTELDPFVIVIEDEIGGKDNIDYEGRQTILVRVDEKAGKFPPGAYEFALDEGAYQDSNVFYDVEAGEHIIWVRDKVTGACAQSKVISIMNYPKFFTPNGDGFNDTWNVLGIKNQPGAKVHIFDRNGKLLKQVSPMGEGWDGTYGGQPMPSTDYWFTVEYLDYKGNRREHKGHFSLKR